MRVPGNGSRDQKKAQKNDSIISNLYGFRDSVYCDLSRYSVLVQSDCKNRKENLGVIFFMSSGRIMWNMESPVKGFSIGQVVWYKPLYYGSSSQRAKICKIELEDNEVYFLIRLFDSCCLMWADFSELRPYKGGGIFKKCF